MLKPLEEKSLLKLLEMFIKIPTTWKEAEVIPKRKPGKDPTKPTSHRPIDPASNLCQIMERMIADRPKWPVWSPQLLSERL